MAKENCEVMTYSDISAKTRLILPQDLSFAVDMLKHGGVVAIPTETVYGLAANALDDEAVRKIFIAKGRPTDNPLILHISLFQEIYDLVSHVPSSAKKLADAFWPGPLTLVLRRSSVIGDNVTASLDTVAVRMPCHNIARKIIRECGFPLAAPSANLSGSPSPTTAQHVMRDLNGKIDAVVDGGECSVGLESTVVYLCDERPRLLRPGGITISQIESVVGKVDIDDAVSGEKMYCGKASSPGMKYKHYSPKADVTLVIGPSSEYVDFVNEKAKCKKNVGALCFDEEAEKINAVTVPYGRKLHYQEQAQKLFSSLRKFDLLDVNEVFAHCDYNDEVALAIYNRLIRAACFKVVRL